ncbi:hypothetical protein ig2599ANME_0878 [groundwater metagenome]
MVNRFFICYSFFRLQLAGILIAFPIGMGFIYNENQAIIPLFVTSFAFFFVGFLLNALSVREELDLKQKENQT